MHGLVLPGCGLVLFGLRRRVQELVEAGWARLSNGGARLSLTVEGWLRLDELVPMLANPGSRF